MSGDFYVYAHRRKDTGTIFYVGKGCKGRAKTRSQRTAAWRAVCDEAGGFDVEYLAVGLTDEAARDIEAKHISDLGGLLVNARPLDNRVINRPLRATVNTSVDPNLVAWLHKWRKAQVAEVTFSRALDVAIREFRDQQTARLAK